MAGEGLVTGSKGEEDERDFARRGGFVGPGRAGDDVEAIDEETGGNLEGCGVGAES